MKSQIKNKGSLMNKSESKYFNTARLMDEALLILLEKKDIEFITVKEICKKAGVNRSTFYLHYENVYELLAEALEMINDRFIQSFEKETISEKIKNGNKEDLNLITPEYLRPYLKFIKENKRAFKLIHKKPDLFNVEQTFQKMYKNIFEPILEKFNINGYRRTYIFEFYIGGVVSIIKKWVELDCKTDIEDILNTIIECCSE